MRVAVVGHVEWIEFAVVERVPAAGEIVHAEEVWEEVGGGGAVAAVQLAKLAGGGDVLHGSRRRRARRAGRASGWPSSACGSTPLRAESATRRSCTLVDRPAERTITTLGPRLGPGRDDPLPWDELAEADSGLLHRGDAGAVATARRAGRLVVATSRPVGSLAEARAEARRPRRQRDGRGRALRGGGNRSGAAVGVRRRRAPRAAHVSARRPSGRLGRPRRAPGPSPTPTAAATASPPGVTYAWGRGARPRRRSTSPHAAEPPAHRPRAVRGAADLDGDVAVQPRSAWRTRPPSGSIGSPASTHASSPPARL